MQTLGLLSDDDETSWYGSLTPIGSLAGALLGGVLTHQFGRKLSTMITCLPLGPYQKHSRTRVIKMESHDGACDGQIDRWIAVFVRHCLDVDGTDDENLKKGWRQ